MKIDTAGDYILRYTATDSCGKSAVVDRPIEVTEPPRTVLYSDGTLIINELAVDKAKNEVRYGNASAIYVPFDPNGNTDVEKYIFNTDLDRPWHNRRTSVKKVLFGSKIQPTSTSYWFHGFTECKSINHAKLDTSKVTTMNRMYVSCNKLTGLGLNSFDTSNVTNMSSMFDGCSKLTSINLSSFNTSKVTDMSSMFSGLGAITSLNLSTFDTSNVTNMNQMFFNCKVTSLDLSGLNTSKVTDMGGMFNLCNLLTNLNISGFDVSNVTNFSEMFRRCDVLSNIDVSGFHTTNAQNMSSMFEGDYSVRNLDLTNFDMSNVTNTSLMFKGCTGITTIYSSNAFSIPSTSTSTDMFANMSIYFVGGAGTAWSSDNPTDRTYAHIDGGTSNPGYFTLKS